MCIHFSNETKNYSVPDPPTDGGGGVGRKSKRHRLGLWAVGDRNSTSGLS